MGEETLIHLFCSCTYTISFWSAGFLWIEEKTNVSIVMDNNAFLFGNTNATCYSKVVNLILLICRFHVYKMKMNEKRPSFSVLKKDVKNYYLMEKIMFYGTGASSKFHKKW